jgi:hypothetical protein
VQVPYDEGVANHIGPESCAVAREDLGEALTGERIGQPLSRERVLFWVPTPCIRWKAICLGATARGPDDPAWSETLACADAPCAGTGRSRDRPLGKSRRSASGRRGAIADDVRSREVRLCHSSWEADEQRDYGRSGAGGAKGGGQGECEPAKHGPGTEPGKPCHRRWSAFGEPPLTSHRHSPKAGAVCGNSARTDLSGGRSAMAVPTALHFEFCRV